MHHSPSQPQIGSWSRKTSVNEKKTPGLAVEGERESRRASFASGGVDSKKQSLQVDAKKRAHSLVTSKGASQVSTGLATKRENSVGLRREEVKRDSTKIVVTRAKSATRQTTRSPPPPPPIPSPIPSTVPSTIPSPIPSPRLEAKKPQDPKPVKKEPQTKVLSGSVQKYTSAQWQDTTMIVNPTGTVNFVGDNAGINLREGMTIVYWTFTQRTDKRYRFKFVDTAVDAVFQVSVLNNLEKWVKCFEGFGCSVQRPLRQGLLSLKDKSESYFVLYSDSMRQLKQAADAEFSRTIRLDDGALLEHLEGDLFCLWEPGDEHANSVSVSLDESWQYAIRRAIHARSKKKYPTSLREGYLWRAVKRKWQRQYCVLTQEGFYYFDTKAEEQSAGLVALSDGADAESASDVEAGPKQHRFWIAENGDDSSHRFVFAAKSAKQKEKWLSTIFNLLESKQTRVNLLSIKEGYLYKRSTGGKWARKFFVLLMDQLLYYAKRSDISKPTAIDLNQGVEIGTVAGDVAGNRAGVFSLAENGDESTRTYYFQAKDNSAREQWLEVLRALALTKDTRLNHLSAKEGYLLKEQRDKKKWNKRYFVLLPTNDTLIYLKKRNAASPSCEISITGAAEITLADDKERKFIFSIAENGDEVGTRTYHLACETAISRTQWVSAISKMIKSQVCRQFQDSILEDYLWEEFRLASPGRKEFFVLRQNQLMYFKKRNDLVQTGMMDIGDEAEIVAIDDGAFPATFSVRSSGDDNAKVLRLYARDPAARDEWVNALRKQIQAGKTESPTSIREGYIYLWESAWKKKYFILEPSFLLLLNKRKDQSPHLRVELGGNVVVHVGNGDDQKTDKIGCPHVILSGAQSKPIRLKTDDGQPHTFAALVIEQCIKSEFPTKDARDLKWGPLTCRAKATDNWAPHFVVVTKDRLWCYKPDDEPVCTVALEQPTQINLEGDGSLQLHDVNDKEMHIMFQSSQEQQSWLPTIMQSISTSNVIRNHMFGAPLSASFATSPFYDMSAVVVMCLNFLHDSPALVSLLQDSGSHILIRSFIQDFENGLDVYLTDAPSVIACLRLYLVMLTEPIIPDELSQGLVDAIKSSSQVQIMECLSNLDRPNATVLNSLLCYLAREAHQSLSQVASVWAPVLMRKGSEKDNAAVLSELILNFEKYFPHLVYPVRKLAAEKLEKLREECQSLSLDQVLRDKMGMELFLQFAIKNFVMENVHFLLAVEKYRALCLAPRPNRQACLAAAMAICCDCVEPEAKLQLNVSDTMRNAALATFRPKPPQKLTGSEFLPLETEVNQLLRTNEFPRFQASLFWDHWITYRRSKSRELRLPTVIVSADRKSVV